MHRGSSRLDPQHLRVSGLECLGQRGGWLSCLLALQAAGWPAKPSGSVVTGKTMSTAR